MLSSSVQMGSKLGLTRAPLPVKAVPARAQRPTRIQVYNRTATAVVEKVNTAAELAKVRTQFDRWNASLQTKDPKKVAALYAPDAVLLPTVSNKVRTTPEEIEDYFTQFLKLQPFGTVNESDVRLLTPETAIHSGVYTFQLNKNGFPAKVQARFSFTYKKIDGQWLIIDHHSSGMPEPVAA
uniref:Calcium/calmodulin-dependent protein kinase II association-domain domain-containing protein n=1 Tax=Chlamydomonas chlamydogama TaxID=225041 RepID=A0A7S2QTI1_9CHLO|mmetsp:Transcript_1759/g.3890  ORF Transcript_1759/g.3890 Transcript_1759/m.3890 type:complete len:181 (+) Transcript_1759:122-664(+)